MQLCNYTSWLFICFEASNSITYIYMIKEYGNDQEQLHIGLLIAMIAQ